MYEILGKTYHIDVDEFIEICRPIYPSGEPKKVIVEKSDDNHVGLELNVFKFEVLKACLERVLNEYEEVDEKITVFAENSLSLSFKLAFNTLLKYKILKEDDDE